MKFQPGRSGNPKGKPLGTKNRSTIELQQAAREYSGEALQTLVQICRHGGSEQARIAAANSILDRAYGRPPQALHHTGDGGGPVQHQHNVDAFLEQLRQIRRRKEETELPEHLTRGGAVA